MRTICKYQRVNTSGPNKPYKKPGLVGLWRGTMPRMVDLDDLYGPMEVGDDLSTALGTETLVDRDMVPPGFDNNLGFLGRHRTASVTISNCTIVVGMTLASLFSVAVEAQLFHG